MKYLEKQYDRNAVTNEDSEISVLIAIVYNLDISIRKIASTSDIPGDNKLFRFTWINLAHFRCMIFMDLPPYIHLIQVSK